MRKLMLVSAALVAAALVMTTCDKKTDDGDNGGGATSDYFPMTIGSAWTWRSDAHYVNPDTTMTDTQMMRAVSADTLSNGKSVVTIEMSAHGWTDTIYVHKSSNCVLFFHELDSTDCDTLLLLPLEQGKSWTRYGGTSRTTVIGKEDVTVPAGNFPECWKLVTIGPPMQCTVYTWLGRGTGDVMEHIVYHDTAGGYTINSELISVDVKP
jgi:hypothetical protein